MLAPWKLSSSPKIQCLPKSGEYLLAGGFFPRHSASDRVYLQSPLSSLQPSQGGEADRAALPQQRPTNWTPLAWAAMPKSVIMSSEAMK